MERAARVHFQGWGGSFSYECTVVGETAKSYRVVYPFHVWRNRRLTEAGKPVRVPKHAVEFTDQKESAPEYRRGPV